MALVNAIRIAQLLNLSEQRVHQLVKLGLPREARGQYDPMRCMLFYVRYLQMAIEKKAEPTLDGGHVGEREERIRLIRASADLKEMKLAGERAQTITVAVHESELIDLVRTTTAVIMAVPPRLAPALVGETSRVMVQAKMEKAFREALTLLAHEGRK